MNAPEVTTEALALALKAHANFLVAVNTEQNREAGRPLDVDLNGNVSLSNTFFRAAERLEDQQAALEDVYRWVSKHSGYTNPRIAGLLNGYAPKKEDVE